MANEDRKRLKEIHTFPALVKYLREDLGWPVEQASFDDLDEITFDWEADELGIDPDHAAKIEYIKQLRPLEKGQPEGVFFVKFNAKSLPVVALRRLLSKLVIKKRATATAAERPLWAMRDLVFISSYGSSEERQLSFAYFQESEQKTELATLKVLGWDDRDTALHLDRVHDLLTSHLTWPLNAKSLPTWRKDWSKAFELRHGQVVSTAKELAEQLATLARGIRERANQLLKLETEKGPLRTLMAGFKAALIHDLTEDQFADMYAQTIAYGLLSARITQPDSIKAETLPDLIPVTNPFLKELMETFVLAGGKHRGRKGGHHLDFDELGINDVVELLRRANIDAVLRNFGANDRKEDPVTYFYEEFLNAYDAKERKRRGVYYTPRPVVSYIVKSVHELLQTEFGIEDGLASTITWGEIARRKDLRIPTGISADCAFVQVLDPATGTATFLVEVIDVILATLKAQWYREDLTEPQQAAAWNAYVPRHLLPRLYGYELMMAPYAIAHLKIGLKLFETGYRFGSDARAHIYLTNALEPASDSSNSQIDALSEALAHEATAVNSIKRDRRFTVVIGNPPYSNYGSMNANAWILGLLKRYKNGLNEKKLNLDDDYIKFLCFTESVVTCSGVGIAGLITNHTFLDGVTHRRIRESWLETYSLVHVLDLHGSSKKAEVCPDGTPDQNVFDIQQGVSLSMLVLRVVCKASSESRQVMHADLWGTRKRKYDWLEEHSLCSTPWNTLHPAPDRFYFAPKSVENQGEYQGFFGLRQVFQEAATGFETARDHFAIAFTAADLRTRIEALLDKSSDAEIRDEWGLDDKRDWALSTARKRLRGMEAPFADIRRIAYRPFDSRFTHYNDVIVTWPRRRVLGDISRRNPALVAARMIKGEEPCHFFVTVEPTEKIFISGKTSNNAFIFPLYARREDLLSQSPDEYCSNIAESFLREVGQILKIGMPEPTSQDIFNYIYAIFHSDSYRRRYAELLKIDFPRFPLTGNVQLFRSLSRLGHELVACHTMESPGLDKGMTNYMGPKTPVVGRIAWSDDTIWLNAQPTKKVHEALAGNIGFEGVREDVWNFHIGGYQVCEKWLKDRKGRKLSKDDIDHYQKIVVALSKTIRIMKEIDQVIDKHGGWPAAFQTDATETTD